LIKLPVDVLLQLNLALIFFVQPRHCILKYTLMIVPSFLYVPNPHSAKYTLHPGMVLEQ
jgi:hypothetical protein